MKLPIIQDLTILRQKSLPATEEEAKQIIADLDESLDLSRGCGLSAVQVGILRQVAIVRLPNMKIDIVNPIIISKGGKFRNDGEACLSLPGLKINTVRYWNFSFVSQGILYTLSGQESIVAQHEIQHFAGLLIIDKSVKWRAR